MVNVPPQGGRKHPDQKMIPVNTKKKMLYELDNIYKSLGEKDLIKDFTARILQKDTIAIVGPSKKIQRRLFFILRTKSANFIKFTKRA